MYAHPDYQELLNRLADAREQAAVAEQALNLLTKPSTRDLQRVNEGKVYLL